MQHSVVNGNRSPRVDPWTSGDGLTALAEFGVAVRVLPRLEVLSSQGARVGLVNVQKFENWFHNLNPVFTWATPFEIGFRYSI